MLTKALNSVECKIRAWLSILVLSLLTLVALLTNAWGWSTLATITTVSLCFYPLCWVAWRVWRFWSLSLMRLTTYTQSLAMGESGVLPAQHGKSKLIDDLCQEIRLLNLKAQGNTSYNQSLSTLLLERI